MGNFFGSLQFRSDDQGAVLEVLRPLASPDHRLLCGPSLHGWVGAYPEGAGQDATIADEAAARWPCELLHVLVHDDDVFAYRYYRAGELVDSYWSTPGYFGEEHREREEPLVGHPELFAHLGVDTARLRRLLAREGDVSFESQRLAAFASLLGIANAATSYEMLEEGERHGVRGWKEFVHLPARPNPREAAKQARQVRAAAISALRKRGLLLVDKRVDAEPETWGGNPVLVEVRGRELELRVRTDADRRPVHPSGVAVGRTGTAIVICEDGSQTPRLQLPIGPVQPPNALVRPFALLDSTAGVPLTGDELLPLLLPLAQEERRGDAEALLRRLMVGRSLDRMERFQLAKAASIFSDDGKQIVALSLSSDGRWLFCGTNQGVRAYAWDELLAAADGAVAPVHFRYDILPEQLEANWSGGYVYGLAHDEARDRLLFAGMDGRIRSLSLIDGTTDHLVDPVGRPPIMAMRLLDGDLLATWSASYFATHKRPAEKPILQVWDYAALRATGDGAK